MLNRNVSIYKLGNGKVLLSTENIFNILYNKLCNYHLLKINLAIFSPE